MLNFITIKIRDIFDYLLYLAIESYVNRCFFETVTVAALNARRHITAADQIQKKAPKYITKV